MAFVRAGIIAITLVILAAIGLRTADAAFSATTTSASNTWTSSSISYLSSGDFQRIYPSGTSNGAVSWTGTTVKLTKIASILSYATQPDVTFTLTGSMQSSPTPMGYGLWSRGSVSGSKITGYEFRVDRLNNRFALHWWYDGSERITPWAQAAFPSGFDASAAHTVSVTTLGDALQATVDGTVVLTTALPTVRERVSGKWFYPPTGAKYGMRTWASTVAFGAQITAYAASGSLGVAGASLMSMVDCPSTEPMGGTNPVVTTPVEPDLRSGHAKARAKEPDPAIVEGSPTASPSSPAAASPTPRPTTIVPSDSATPEPSVSTTPLTDGVPSESDALASQDCPPTGLPLGLTPPTPRPSASPKASATGSPTASPSPTASATASPTASPSPTASATASPTASPSPTPLPSATGSDVLTPDPTNPPTSPPSETASPAVVDRPTGQPTLRPDPSPPGDVLPVVVPHGQVATAR